MILPGGDSQALAVALSRATSHELGEVSTDRFPDGELVVEVPTDPGNHAVIVASTVSHDAFVELLLLQDAVREAGASTITTVVPYLGYARQDEAFEPGQPVSIRPLARAIGAGTDRVITVDPHETSVLEHFRVSTTAVSAADRLAGTLPDDLVDPLFLGPDASATDEATTVRDAYGTGAVDHFEKVRTSGRSVELSPNDADVAGRDVVIVDDMISTGGTMSEAAAVLHERDVETVFAACVHPLLVAGARARLANAGIATVVGTDTIERPESRVSAAPAVATALEAPSG